MTEAQTSSGAEQRAALKRLLKLAGRAVDAATKAEGRVEEFVEAALAVPPVQRPCLAGAPLEEILRDAADVVQGLAEVEYRLREAVGKAVSR